MKISFPICTNASRFFSWQKVSKKKLHSNPSQVFTCALVQHLNIISSLGLFELLWNSRKSYSTWSYWDSLRLELDILFSIHFWKNTTISEPIEKDAHLFNTNLGLSIHLVWYQTLRKINRVESILPQRETLSLRSNGLGDDILLQK